MRFWRKPCYVPRRKRAVRGLAVIGVMVGLAACAETELALHAVKRMNGAGGDHAGANLPDGYKVGEPYRVNGVWYYPAVDPYYEKVGIASWYGGAFHGRSTANGERFNMNAVTAAHPTLPLPSLARVTNLHNGRAIVVRINDRGPFARGRIIDLSKRAAEMLGFRRAGTAKVRVQYLGLAELAPNAVMAAADTASADATANPESDAVAAAPVAPEPPPPPPKPAIAASTPFFIEVGLFGAHAEAVDALRRVSQIGQAMIVRTGQSAARYRVSLGPLAGEPEAESALARVTLAGFVDARILDVADSP